MTADDKPASDYHTACDTDNKAIIHELADESGDMDIAQVIKCYTIGSSDKDIRKLLNKIGVPPLKKAAVYLGLDADSEPNIKFKDDIIRYIITRIESLLRDLCGVCGQYFNNKLTDEPTFSCLICNQGCHEPCFQEMIKVFAETPGDVKKSFHFICTKCKGDFVKDTTTHPKSPTKSKKGEEDIVSSEETFTGNIAGGPSDQVNHQTDEAASPDPEEDPEIARRRARNKDPTVAVCPVYKWGMCTNYDKCDYRHPPRCYRWLSNGNCKYRDKCRFHHPPLCLNSLEQRLCLDNRCKFFHLSKTIRPRDNEQLKTALHADNYYSQQNRQVQPMSFQNQQAQRPPVNNQPQRQANAYRNQGNQQPRNYNGMNNGREEVAEFQYHPSNFPPMRPQTNQAHQQNQPQQFAERQYQQPSASETQPPQSLQRQGSTNLNQTDLSFLAKTIGEAIKGDLVAEIENIKQELKQMQNTAKPQVITNPSFPKGAPIMYGYPMQGVTLDPQTGLPL